MDKITNETKKTEPMIIFLYYSGQAVHLDGNLHLIMPDHIKNGSINISEFVTRIMRRKNVLFYAFYDFSTQKKLAVALRR